MNFNLITSTQYDKSIPADKAVIHPLKEVRPCYTLRIDIGQLLDRKTLSAETFNAERHFKQLVLSPSERALGEEVWMRVNHQFFGSLIECVDPTADDLARCDHTFILLLKTESGIGFLEEVAAPSFSGSKAINLIWNLMAISGLKEAFLHDGSMLLPATGHKPPCCEEGALTDLRPLTVFTDGKSWYEKQGALPEISLLSFMKYIDAFDEELGDDVRLSKHTDFNKVMFERCALYLKESQPSPRAYISACNFLSSLPISRFDASLSLLAQEYPSLEKLKKTIQQAAEETATQGSLGSLMRATMAKKEDKSFHFLHHELRDRLVSNKETILSQYISYALLNDTLPTELLCALALLALHAFLSLEEDVQTALFIMKADNDQLDALSKKACEDFWKKVVISVIKPSYAHKKELAKERLEEIWDIAKKSFPDTPKPPVDTALNLQIRQMLSWLSENYDEIASVKVYANSNRVQRQRYVQYALETYAINPFQLTQQALFYLTRMPMARLSAACPELVNFLKTKFPITDTTTIEELINASDISENTWIMQELLQGSKKHLSTLFVRYMDRHPINQIPTQDLYPIFLLSKHICESKSEFVLKLT